MYGMNINIFSLPSFAISLLLFFIFVSVLTYENTRGRLAFAFLICVSSLYSFFYALQLSTFDPFYLTLYFKLGHAFYSFAPLAFYFFSVSYTKKKWNYIQLAIFTCIPIITTILLCTGQKPDAFLFRSFDIINNHNHIQLMIKVGPWDFVAQAYSFYIFVDVFIRLIRNYKVMPQIFHKQTIVILIGASFPIIGHIFFYFSIINIFKTTIIITPYLLMCTSLLSYYVLTKLKLFHYSPVIRDLVFDAISDGVLIYDENFLLLEINSAGSVLLKNKHKALGFSIVEELLFWDKIKDLVSKNNKRFVINVSQDKTAETFYELFHEIIDTGNLYLHILIIHDITSRKRILETVEQKRFDTLGLL